MNYRDDNFKEEGRQLLRPCIMFPCCDVMPLVAVKLKMISSAVESFERVTDSFVLLKYSSQFFVLSYLIIKFLKCFLSECFPF